MKQWNYLGVLKVLNKDKNDENVAHLQITGVVLVHCNIVNNNYQVQGSCMHLYLINRFVNIIDNIDNILDISPKRFVFFKTFISEFSYIENGLLIKILNR